MRASERRPVSPARSLPAAIFIIGLVSLFNDLASEMVVPLIPLLLATALGAGPLALGLIEGLADAVSNLLKLWSGRHSDLGRRRKPYAVAGYALSNVARPLVALATSWSLVLAFRVVDRIGKGLRTAPRDALIADLAPEAMTGRAYGLTRGLDHAGAVFGALAAAAIVHFGTDRLEAVIALSAIPGFAAVILFAFGVGEPPRAGASPEQIPPLRWSAVGEPARRYLLVVTAFALGRIPETFVLLRGHELGMSVVALLLLWAGIHVVKVTVAERAGRRADRHGRRPVILTGWAMHAPAILALGLVTEAPFLCAWALLLGASLGMTEGAERALVRDLARPGERGTAFGWFHMLVGIAAMPAGLMLGGLWALAGAKIAFLVSAAITAVATAAFWRLVR